MVTLHLTRGWAGLAQLVERLICNQDVTSSNLVAGTIFFFDVLNRAHDHFEPPKLVPIVLSRYTLAFCIKPMPNINDIITLPP